MRPLLPLVIAVSLMACGGTSPSPDGASATSPVGTSSPNVTVPPASEPTSPAPASPAAVDLPAGLPPFFEDDVVPANVPAAALVPLQTEVTGTWYGTTAAGDALVVAWQVPGDDPFALERGVAVWRRFADGGPPWRPVWGTIYPARAGVLGIDALTQDVTGDASDEALLVAQTGGSGACGRYTVVDMGAGTTVFQRRGCDTRIDPSTDPVGLAITEAVYESGDPHCCPSAFRETVLTYDGGTWGVTREELRPA
jgi:hypothetical protein